MELAKTAGAAGDGWGQYTALGTSVQNQDYIASGYVYVGAGCTARIQLQKNAGVGVQQVVIVDLVGPAVWTRIETPVLTANATGDNMFLFVLITGTPTVAAYFDALLSNIF